MINLPVARVVLASNLEDKVFIKRIDHDKDVNQKCDRIEIVISGKKYTITEEFGRMCLHAHSSFIDIKPCVANEITIGSNDD